MPLSIDSLQGIDYYKNVYNPVKFSQTAFRDAGWKEK